MDEQLLAIICWIAIPSLLSLALIIIAFRLCYLEEQALLKQIHEEIKRAQAVQPAYGKPTLVKDAADENA
jgi:Na+/melibiose symporter-like transporter